jgi:hypothetical protein
MSIFDVSDSSALQEVSTVEMGIQRTSSDALDDHRAFLYDDRTGMLVLPVSLYCDETLHANPSNDLSACANMQPSWTQDSSTSSEAFEGAFVYNISAPTSIKPERFQRLGMISHHTLFTERPTYYDHCPDTSRSDFPALILPKWASCRYGTTFDRTLKIRRSLYVGEFLYTVRYAHTVFPSLLQPHHQVVKPSLF